MHLENIINIFSHLSHDLPIIPNFLQIEIISFINKRSEERRVGKECS